MERLAGVFTTLDIVRTHDQDRLPAVSYKRATKEGGQNITAPPLSTPFTACAHLLYARTPAARSCCGCLF